MVRVACVLLGAPASSGVLERDFSATGRLMASARSTTDAARVEMMLLLTGNKSDTPLNVGELTAAEKKGCYPRATKEPRTPHGLCWTDKLSRTPAIQGSMESVISVRHWLVGEVVRVRWCFGPAI